MSSQLSHYKDENIKRLLLITKNIAVIGASLDESKPSNRVILYLHRNGYNIYPVNPLYKKKMIHGIKIYESTEELNKKIDIVNIFRKQEFLDEETKLAIKLKPKCIWMQLGLKSNYAARIANKKNIIMIMDHCTKIEHKRLIKNN